jgi:hypothetical protein
MRTAVDGGRANAYDLRDGDRESMRRRSGCSEHFGGIGLDDAPL